MKKGIKISIIVVLIMLILAGAALAYLYLKTDTFKSDEELFIEYSKVMLENLCTIIEDNNTQNYEQRKLTSSYSNSGNLEVAVQEKSETETFANDSTLIDFKTKVDNANNNFQGEFNIHYADDVVLPISVVNNSNSKFGITSREIMKAYAAIENENLKDFFDKLGIDSENIPDKIEEDGNEELFKEYFSRAMKEYINVIKNVVTSNITSEDFSKEQSNKNGYVFKISEAKMKKITLEILNQTKNDETILEIFRNLPNYTEELEENYKNEFDELIENVNAIDVQEDRYIVITIYETENGVTTGKITSSDNSVLQIDTSKDNVKVTMYDDNGSKVGLLELTKVTDINSTKYELNIESTVQPNNIFNEGNTIVGDTASENDALTENSSILMNAKYEITGMNTDNTSEKLTVVVNYNSSDSKMALGMEYKSDVEFKEDVGIEKLDDSNSVILNDLSRDTLVTTLNQVINKVIELNNSKIDQAKQSKNKSIIIILVEQTESLFQKAENAREQYENQT